MSLIHRPVRKKQSAFTLVELLVSMAVVLILMVVLLSITSQTSTVIKRTSGKIEQFREVREAFDSMGRKISQATLNTYWDYDDPNTPTRYTRQSELRFISGDMTNLGGTPPGGKQWVSQGIFFQAPLGFSAAPTGTQPDPRGLEDLLNTWGYFIEYGDDSTLRPTILTSPARTRFRLCEFMQTANDFNLYNYTSGTDANGKPKTLTYVGKDWFTAGLTLPAATRPVHVVADNVLAMIILPKLSSQEDATDMMLSPNYSYDSTSTSATAATNPKNQLPPIVQMTLVAMDEASAGRITDADSTEIINKLKALFLNANNYQSDFVINAADASESLEELLVRKHINYRVFTTNIILKGAKWSREQKN